MRWKVFLSCACLPLSLAQPARADVITDWNSTAIAVSRAAGDPALLRTLAMVHIAMFDAVNSVVPRFHPYAVQLPDAGASPEAAAAAGAYGILIRRFPSQQAALDSALAASLAAVADGSAEDAGRQLGDAVAAAIHQLRVSDGMFPPNNPPYVPGTGPGAYQLTSGTPVNTGAAAWKPFAMTSPSQFRPNGPPSLRTKTYARDLEEVRLLGTWDAALRTPDQNLIAQWHIEMGQFQLFRIAREAVLASSFDLLTSARLFALLGIALVDGQVGVFEAKYHYNFWRPLTAIRAADTDGNDETAADPGWSPFLPTPAHPEYPAAHTTISSAGVTVLEKFLGQHYAFEAAEDVAQIPGVQVRQFPDLQALVDDMLLARIYGGMHFRTSGEEGAKQGKKIGKWVLENLLLPLQ